MERPLWYDFEVSSSPAPASVKPSTPTIPETWSEASVRQLREQFWPTAKYLTRTDVHTFAFSVAANAILSFFPFVLLMLTLSRKTFHSERMFEVIVSLMRDYLPTSQDFIVRNMRALVASRHKASQIYSIGILLFTSTGVFLPLEVALNKVWGFEKNRSYLGNQAFALGLAFGCGVLAMMSVAVTAGNQALLGHLIGENFVSRVVDFAMMKLFAILCSVFIFFLIYWLLPNGKVPPKAVLPAAFVAGLFMEVAKYAYMFSLPWLNFQEVYGPFAVAVTMIIWAYVAGMLLLGGAHLSAIGTTNGKQAQNGGGQ
jgi:YihY family inner membrane protein